MSGELGNASLDLEANLDEFRRQVREAEASGRGLGNTLDHLAVLADEAAREVNRVRMDTRQAAESRAIADRIEASAGRVGRAAMEASQHLQEVKISAEQAAESDVAGDVIDRKLKDITRNANEARRATESVRLAGGVPGRSGVGVGIFGSGFGRIGLMGTAVGAGTLLGPAAGPAAAGLLAATPVLAGTAAGALGALVLAFDGVGKAIGGDKKAFDSLVPAQQQFVQEIRSLDGWLDQLKQTAAGDMFPGLERGLHEALSPGTLNAVTRAVEEFSHAIGAAGEEWGRYFGSSEFQQIFGPLMAEGARNVGQLSDAALHLADSVGLVARDAIPLTDWMMRSIDGAARLADSWLRARDASGQLSGAMREAETSLELVVRLVGSLFNAVGALGDALYPVSKIAVKDLTDGLNALARIIENNKDEIRDIVGGALKAFEDAVRVTADIVGKLWPVLHAVVEELGGWANIFELLIGYKIATVVTGWAASFAKLASEEALGAAVSKSSLLLSNLTALKMLGPIAIAVTVDEIVQKITGSNADFSDNASTGGSFKPGARYTDKSTGITYVFKQGATPQTTGWFPVVGSGPGRGASMPTGGAGARGGSGAPGSDYSQRDVYSLLLANGVPKDVATNLSIISAQGEDRSGDPTRLNDSPATGDYSVGLFQENFLGQMGVDRVRKYAPQFGLSPNTPVAEFVRWLGMHPSAQAQIAYQIYQSQGYGAWTTAKGLGITGSGSSLPFGTPPPFTSNLGPAAPKPPVIPSLVTDLLNRASENASKAMQLGNAGGTARRYLEDELSEYTAAQKKLQQLTPKTAVDRQQVQAKLTEVSNKIRDINTLIKNSILLTGDDILGEALKARLQQGERQFAADSAYAQTLTGQAAEDYQKTLLSDLTVSRSTLQEAVTRLKAKVASDTGKQRQADQTELNAIQQKLSDINDQITQSLQSKVQTLQQHVSSFMSSVTSELDQQFEAQTQSMLDEAAQRFYQNGALTPLEQQLQDMQQADQLKSLTDAVSSAATPEDKAAAQRQLDEYRLQLRATEQRRQADEQYAAEVKRITVERQKLEDEMNKKLAELSDQFENGTGTMADLTAVAATYGLQITDETVPDFENLSGAVSGLQSAIGSLIDYIATLTGSRPTVTGGASATVAQAMATPLGQWTQSMADAFNAAGGDLGALAMYGGLPAHALGGIAIHPTVGVFGEKGPEALIPLTDRRAIEMLGAGAGGSNAPTTVVLEVDRRALARAVVRGVTDDTSSKTKLAATLSK